MLILSMMDLPDHGGIIVIDFKRNPDGGWRTKRILVNYYGPLLFRGDDAAATNCPPVLVEDSRRRGKVCGGGGALKEDSRWST